MERTARVASFALALAATASGCASTACPATAVCGAATWAGAENTHVEGRMLIAPAVDLASAGTPPGSLADRLAVQGLAPSLLRFDPSAIAVRGAVVERAVLSLAAHPSWHPSDARVRLFARGVDSPWSAATTLATLAAEPVAEASLPPRTRVPIRLDVTRVVRAWAASGDASIALTTDGERVVFDGPGAPDAADRPRLEVLLR